MREQPTDAEFDIREVFDDDYLYFYEQRLSERTDADVDLIWRLLELVPGTTVLDLACGHGRIANQLAERGCRVTGLDLTASFLELARRDAAERGVTLDYVEGDMRSLPWRHRFDRIVCWFTSFGYFDDDANRRVLAEAFRALKPGGRLLIETIHRDSLVRRLFRDFVEERDGNYMIDRVRFDVLMGRLNADRIALRDGHVRSFSYFVRVLSYTELRNWLSAVGFTRVEAFGEEGAPLTLESARMIVVAQR